MLHLARHGWYTPGRTLTITQGVEIQRPSELKARVDGTAEHRAGSGSAAARWSWRRDTSASNSLPPMKLATFRPDRLSEPLAGVVNRDSIHAFARGAHAVREVLAGGLTADADIGCYALADVELLAPIPHPGTIFAIGLNYADHIAEMGIPCRSGRSCSSRSTRRSRSRWPIVCPEVVRRLDYEGELMIVIGRDGRIGGYCVANESALVTCRSASLNGCAPRARTPSAPSVPGSPPPTRCRTHRTSASGPGSTASCARDSNTSNLVFGIDELIAFLAETCTLRPGDLILTGTPGGVGQGMDPPRYLQSGD